MFLDFYVAVLHNLGFMICSSYTEQVLPPLLYTLTLETRLLSN